MARNGYLIMITGLKISSTGLLANGYYGFRYTSGIVTDGLILHLDAANPASYPGSGTTWYDLSGVGNNFTLDAVGLTYNSGVFDLTNAGGAFKTNMSGLVATCTVVFWIKTTDVQALFLHQNTGGGYYLGAYRSGNKEYYGTCGSPGFYMDTNDTANIYDYISDGNWHMLEFKNVDLSNAGWTSLMQFNKYSSFTFANGSVAIISIYNRNLTQAESTQNFNAARGRFGI
jgi:hypothetical protein